MAQQIFRTPMSPAQIGAATERLWAIRHLVRAGAVDPRAALASLGVLAGLPHTRLAGLARDTIEQIAPGLLGTVEAIVSSN